MPKQVALILLNWNTPVYTANCILSILEHCKQDIFDIIIADNGSTDDSLTFLKTKFPNLIFIENKTNLGFAEGNNKALEYSIAEGYRYSLLLNTDTLVDSDIVQCLSDHLEQNPNVAAAQPAIYWMHDRSKLWNGEGRFNSILGVAISSTRLPKLNDGYKKVEWLTGCCMLIRNTALQKVGLFNPHYFLYYEDVELSYRLTGEGFELHYLPYCKIYHEAGVSAKVEKEEGFLSPIIHFYTSRNHIWFVRKYGNPLLFIFNLLYNGSYYTAVLLYFIIRGRKLKARNLLSGLYKGLFTPLKQIYQS